MKNSSIFVLQMEETGEIMVGTKEEVDDAIKEYENADVDIPFTTIGKIDQPPQGLPLGFDERLIQWYDKTKIPSRRTIDETILKIVQYRSNR